MKQFNLRQVQDHEASFQERTGVRRHVRQSPGPGRTKEVPGPLSSVTLLLCPRLAALDFCGFDTSLFPLAHPGRVTAFTADPPGPPSTLHQDEGPKEKAHDTAQASWRLTFP